MPNNEENGVSGTMPTYTSRSRHYGRVVNDAEQCKRKQQHGESSHLVPFPFLQALRKGKQNDRYNDLYSMLSKVQINLPLLELISNVPSYTKFFKEVCSRKRKFNAQEKVMASEAVNSVLQHTLPPKVKDPGSFNVNIILGDVLCVRAMLDLGASINLMPFSVYEK